MKAAFEEFKRYKDDKVEQRCAEMDAHLDNISMHFDEELYPHMLTVIAGRHWVIGHGLRLAVMKCAESSELRQSFVDVVSAGLAKGMSEGLKHNIEHGRAGRDLADIEAYNPEADSKYVKALHDLKDLKYPLLDQLEKLKDALIDMIMKLLYLESDSGEHTPQWIQEILLEDAIAPNIIRAKNQKKCRVVCRTHRVGFAHHARSNVVLVSVPIIVPQGLAILLADAAMQTKISEDEASLRLLKSKSLPPMYNLD
nr:transposase (putative), gypsy type [Tanacetum cinerariifolium]